MSDGTANTIMVAIAIAFFTGAVGFLWWLARKGVGALIQFFKSLISSVEKIRGDVGDIKAGLVRHEARLDEFSRRVVRVEERLDKVLAKRPEEGGGG